MAFSIKINGLDRLQKNITGHEVIVGKQLIAGIQESIAVIRPYMVKEAPVKTRNLIRSIYARMSGLRGEVGVNTATAPYAIYVEEGTRPHEIRPKTKKALYWKGALYPVKVVRHPGTKANPFMERTVDASTPLVNNIFNKKIDNIVNNLK